MHGAHRGAIVILAVVQTLFGNDLRTLHPIFPEGEEREEFEELVDDLDIVAIAIAEDVSIDSVISNIFAHNCDLGGSN